MRNISFDNPYLLLILIPLLACIIVPIAIAIRKENRSKSVVASTILHIVIALCIALAAGGMIFSSVMTETQIYVVADVSYSGNRNLEQVEAYIQEIEKNLPRNSKLGVVVFGKEAKTFTVMGEERVPLIIKDEKGNIVPQYDFTKDQIAGTDITNALNHVAGLFDEDVIKRVILITDGKQTRTDGAGELVGAVENLYANNINIDAIFIDNNLKDEHQEVQISDVEYVTSTYMGHKTYATVLVQSTYATEDAWLSFFVGGSRQTQKTVRLNKGYTVINFELPTNTAGEFNYKFHITAMPDENFTGDEKDLNNVDNDEFSFSQTVVDHMNVLLITGNAADEARLRQTYPENTEFEILVQTNTSKKLNVPCTVEELCRYDEIVISSIDIRELNNVTAFIDALDTVVSQFGKSLVTMGDLRIQNKTDNDLLKLENMLPVKYGNNAQDPKLFTIVLDVSRSMQMESRLIIAKQAAKHLVNSLDDQDYAMLVVFWGNNTVLMAPSRMGGISTVDDGKTNRELLLEKIDSAQPYQGTMLTQALEEAVKSLREQSAVFSELQIMLISDGRTWATEEDNPVEIVKSAFDSVRITTSVIHPAGRVEDVGQGESAGANPDLLIAIAEAGGGKYYAVRTEGDLEEIMYGQIMDDMTESVVTGDNLQVHISMEKDAVLAGLTAVPNVQGYVNSKAKASANTVLTVDYTKANGSVLEVPLYTYWNYGNGKVSTFTSTLTGEWSRDWQADAGDTFFSNVAVENVPAERVDQPYTLNVYFDGSYTHVELIPVVLNPDAKVTVTFTRTDSTVEEQELIFDSSRYFGQFEAGAKGRYIIQLVYEYGTKRYESRYVHNVSYAPEYNAFERFDPAALHAAIRNRGTVVENGIPSLKNNEKEVTTYLLPLIVPLMALAVALYVIDIIIRKLKISDIKSFFNIKSKKGAGS